MSRQMASVTPAQFPRPLTTADLELVIAEVRSQRTQIADQMALIQRAIDSLQSTQAHVDRLHRLVLEVREDVRAIRRAAVGPTED